MLALHFGFGALEAEFWRWAFLMTRIGAAMVAAPFFGATNVPAQVRRGSGCGQRRLMLPCSVHRGMRR